MSEPLFRRLLGPALDRLPPALRKAHDAEKTITLTGTAEVWRGDSRLAGLLCDLMRLPAAGHAVPCTVTFKRGGTRWRRRFAGRRYSSRFHVAKGLLVERMGPVTNIFRVTASAEGLDLVLVGFRVLGLPLPAALSPRCHAIERQMDGDFTFDIPVALPWLGPVIRYAGRLRPEETR